MVAAVVAGASIGHKGHYHDALYIKKLRVVMLLIEALGGIAPPARAHIAKLAHRSEGRGATDRTKYGGTRISTKSFYMHHSQMLSKAAVMHDAKAIRKRITCLKQEASARPRSRGRQWRARVSPAPLSVPSRGPNGPRCRVRDVSGPGGVRVCDHTEVCLRRLCRLCASCHTSPWAEFAWGQALRLGVCPVNRIR